jgi:hypothetical protein
MQEEWNLIYILRKNFKMKILVGIRFKVKLNIEKKLVKHKKFFNIKLVTNFSNYPFKFWLIIKMINYNLHIVFLTLTAI